MNSKNFILTGTVFILIVLVISGIFFLGKNELNAPILGGDKDVHGCIGSAGYSWCEQKQKCLRVWEEPCAEAEINFTKEGNLTGEVNNWTLVYEEPGKPALTKKLRFDNLSECFLTCEKEICDSAKLNVGERVRVAGNLQSDDTLLVVNMVYVNKPACVGDKQ